MSAMRPDQNHALFAGLLSNTHRALVQGHAENKDIRENWDTFTRFPNIIFEAIQLPALTEVELKPLTLDNQQSAGNPNG